MLGLVLTTIGICSSNTKRSTEGTSKCFLQEMNRLDENTKILIEQAKEINENGCIDFMNGECDNCNLCEYANLSDNDEI